MGDNTMKEAVSCPIRGFSPAEFSASNMNMFSNENQNNLTQNDEKKDSGNNCFGAKDSSSFGLPNMTLMLPKRFDENQDLQDDLTNPDLPNGHNNPDAIDIAHRNKSFGELLQESVDLPDTVLMDCSKDYPSAKEGEQKSNSSNTDKDSETVNSEMSQQLQGNSQGEKVQDSASQDLFEENTEKEGPKQPSVLEKNDTSNSSDNQEGFTEGFDLHLSETQSFLTPGEKENENAVTVSESDDSNAMDDESNDKMPDVTNEKLSDVAEMSNGSSGNTASNLEAPISKEIDSNDMDKENDIKTEQELNREDISNESVEVSKESSEEIKPVSKSKDQDNKVEDSEVDICNQPEQTEESNPEENKQSFLSSDENTSDVKNSEKDESSVSKEESEESPNKETVVKSELPQASVDEAMDITDSKEDNIGSTTVKKEDNESVTPESVEENKLKDEEEMEHEDLDNHVEEPKKEDTEEKEKQTIEEISNSEASSGDKKKEDSITDGRRTSTRPQRKRQSKKEEGNDKEASETDDKKQEAMEIEEPTSDSGSEIPLNCSCQPPCHGRIETVSKHLNNACSQLDDFIKLKRRDENKVLKNFLDMLKEIHSISQNKKVTGESKIAEHILIPEETPPKRKSGVKRKSSDAETPLKEAPRKRSNTEENNTEKSEKKMNVEFKDLKGLAVFAKWPNSGWYYPGKVEELTGNDWKEANNVTVKFYDGLVREMKNINILPAYLIPPGSMLCDLDDETEMVVLSCDGSNQNSVDFKLSTKDNSGRDVELNFNKLAIRANHMKTIKQQLEPTTDVIPKKMHMVSLDNLVSGRRSRGRSKKDADAEEKPPTNQTERRSTGSSSSTASRKSATPKRARN